MTATGDETYKQLLEREIQIDAQLGELESTLNDIQTQIEQMRTRWVEANCVGCKYAQLGGKCLAPKMPYHWKRRNAGIALEKDESICGFKAGPAGGETP